MKLFKKTISLAIVLIMIISLIPTNIVNAAVGDNESNPILYRQSDTTNFPQAPNQGYVLLNKGADWVPNEDNVAKVTMSLQGKGVQKKTDVVLVIDRSGSMSDKIRVYNNEIPVTFVANNVSYQYSTKNSGGSWTNAPISSTATISMTAYIDDNGVFKGYKSDTLSVVGLEVLNAKRYRKSDGSFNSWTSLDDYRCAETLISIFGGKKAQVTIGGNLMNVTFPSNRASLQNTENNYTYSSESKISAAKLAAKEFVSALLSKEYMKNLNKVAVVSYSSSGYGRGQVYVDSQLINNDTSLNTAIDGITANGGTHIQAGISKAQDILNTSTADNKCIVVLSDGEPTYSYKATAASQPTLDDYALNYPSDLDYKLTEFNSSVFGTGGDYDYDSNDDYYANVYWVNDYWVEAHWEYSWFGLVKEWVEGHWEGHWEKEYQVKDNGIPTISQALIAKKSGIEMYSVGFDVTNSSNAIYTMQHVASSVDNFYLATDDLSSVFTNIAGKILKAGTNAKVNNVLGGDINIGYDFTVLKDDAHPVVATQGSAVVSSDAKSINWDLGTSNTGGDITETPATLTYYIQFAVLGGKAIDPNQILNTSNSSSVTYKNYLGNWCKKDFPTSVLTAESGTLNVNYYLADKNGNPINNDGVIIPFRDRVYISDSLNQAVSLGYSVKVSDYAKSINGYVNQSSTAKNEDGVVVSDTIIASRSTIYLNFPYYAEPIYSLSYNGNGNTGGNIPLDNGAYKEGAVVTVLGDGSMVKSGYSFAGWSTTNDGPVTYTQGNSFKMPSHSMTLYAVWEKSDYTLKINYIYEGGATFDTYTDTLSANEPYEVTSPVISGWTAGDLKVSGTMPSANVTKSVYYKRNQNKLLNNIMYPSKGINPISDEKSAFEVAKDFEYTFGFKFESGQDAPNVNLLVSGDTDKYILSNFKLYEGDSTTPVSTGNTFSELDKTKIKDGNTYTITYNLKCSELGVGLTLEVSMDYMINSGVNPISITSKKMPDIQ